MKSLKSLLPSLIALGTAALTIFAPAIQSLIASHPTASAIVAALGVILSHIAPSPLAPKQ